MIYIFARLSFFIQNILCPVNSWNTHYSKSPLLQRSHGPLANVFSLYSKMTESKPYITSIVAQLHVYKENTWTCLLVPCRWTVVEVEVSNLKQQSTERWSLLQKTNEMLNFVSTNGPHPLVSMNVVDSFFDLLFGKQWHFTVNLSKLYVSQSVDAHFRSARQLSNSLASI